MPARLDVQKTRVRESEASETRTSKRRKTLSKKRERYRELTAKLYPWGDLFQANRFKLEQGVHFSCTVSGMAQQVWNAAQKYGKKVSIQTDDKILTVTVEEK